MVSCQGWATTIFLVSEVVGAGRTDEASLVVLASFGQDYRDRDGGLTALEALTFAAVPLTFSLPSR